MRERMLKPGFFKHEGLADLGPWHRLLFAGLWCMADREGRLRDAPAVISGELFPWSTPASADMPPVDTMLGELAAHPDRFIIRYVVAGKRYIAIPGFSRQQRPHHREKPSDIPSLAEPRAKPGVEPRAEPGAEPVNHLRLSPSESESESESEERDRSDLSHTQVQGSAQGSARGSGRESKRSRAAVADLIADEFEAIRAAYPKRSGDHRWRDAERFYRAARKEGVPADKILDGVKRYAAWVTAAGKLGTETVKQAATFINGRTWEEDFGEPVPPSRPRSRAAQQAARDDLLAPFRCEDGELRAACPSCRESAFLPARSDEIADSLDRSFACVRCDHRAKRRTFLEAGHAKHRGDEPEVDFEVEA